MQTITFTRLAGMGPGTQTVSLPVHEFLIGIPHLFHFGHVPPLPVINAFLAEGQADAGMGGGCRWQPFALTAMDYARVRAALAAAGTPVGGVALRFDPVPGQIRDRHEWEAWVIEQEMGVPYGPHLALIRREQALLHRAHEAARNDDPGATALHLAWYHAADELARFNEPYIERYRERRRR